MALFQQSHTTPSLVMVYPHDFGFNEQTGADNAFQHKPVDADRQAITRSAQHEFSAMVDTLRRHQVEVLVLQQRASEQPAPDAIFPNNWFSTRSDGKLFIYPMKTANRQAEVQVENLTQTLNLAGYQVSEVIDLRNSLPPGSILEGTGSLIFHHQSALLFAALSERCQANALAQFAHNYGYQSVAFDSADEQDQPIYHSNVMMSCGDQFAVINDASLTDKQQKNELLKTLANHLEDVICISQQQMGESFCGNILQIRDLNNDPCIVMSATAYGGFESIQIKTLEKHGDLVICDIPTIEFVGGGSARCMIAENFLTKKPSSQSNK